MLNMIKADLFRIGKGKGIYIVFAILIASILLTSYSISPVNMGLGLGDDLSKTYGMSEEAYQNFPDTGIGGTRDYILAHGSYDADLAVMAHNINLYYILVAIVAFVLCCDFSNQTIKNTVSTNISKRNYYCSKLVLCLLLGTAIVFFAGYGSYFTQLLMNGEKFVSSFLEMTNVILRQLPMFYAIISILVVIGVVFRRSSLFNGIAIPLVVIFQLLLMGATQMLHLPNGILNFELETALSKLSFDPSLTYIWECVGLGLSIFLVASLLGAYYFQKKDI